MLASKMHVNTMHEAPPAPPPAPEELSPSASNVPELKEVDALIEDEEKNHQDIAAK